MTGLYDDEKVTAEEKAISAKVAFASLWPHFARHKGKLLYCLTLLLIVTGLSIWWPILVQRGLDSNIKNSDLKGLLITVGLIAIMQVIVLILQYVQRIKIEEVGQDVMLVLRQGLFNHLLSLDSDYFGKHPVGRLMARVESDTEALRTFFTNTALILIGDFLLIAGIVTAMFVYSWKLTLVVGAVVPVILTITYIYERLTTPRFLAIRKNMAEVTATLTEFLQGMSIVQIFNRGDYARGRVWEASRKKFRNDAFAHIGVTAYFNVVFFFEQLAIGLALYFAGNWIAAGEMTVGTFSLFMIFIWKAFEPIWRASEQLSQIQRAIAGAKRVYALFGEKSKLPDPEEPVKLERITKGIRFENVWFSYTEDENWVLKDATFDVPVGKRIALAGVTGGGKSTVIALLLRLYEPQRGTITIDGIDIRNFSKADLRRHFALVLQDIFLFPDTVRANIALESTHLTDDDIIAAAKTVEAHRFIERLPDGYKTMVSEKGSNFSRGERQLLSFARALVRNPEVLLLDEATSSVDPATERLIQNSLKKLMEGRTAIIIAHRLSTILDVDQILVIRRGEIVERGTHSELLLLDGYYAKLFHLQFKHLVKAETTHVG